MTTKGSRHYRHIADVLAHARHSGGDDHPNPRHTP